MWRHLKPSFGGLQETGGTKDAEEDLEKEWEEISRKSGTGMRLVELDRRREGPIDHGECLKVSRCPVDSFIGRLINS